MKNSESRINVTITSLAYRWDDAELRLKLGAGQEEPAVLALLQLIHDERQAAHEDATNPDNAANTHLVAMANGGIASCEAVLARFALLTAKPER